MFKTPESRVVLETLRIPAFLENSIVPQTYHHCNKKQFVQGGCCQKQGLSLFLIWRNPLSLASNAGIKYKMFCPPFYVVQVALPQKAKS